MYLRLASLLLLAGCNSVYGQFFNLTTQAECESLAPTGSTLATGDTPFIVATVDSMYDAAINDTVQVFIASSNPTFGATDVVLQARRASDNADNTPFGTFDVTSGYQLLACGSSNAGTITSTNSDVKNLPISFMWNNNEQNFGSVQFIASLVDSNGLLWSNVVSSVSISSTAGELVQLSIGSCPTPGITGSVATWTPPNCLRGSAVQSQAMCVPPSGTTFPVGTSSSTCTCSDRAESAQCTITVDIAQVSACMPNPCNNGGTCIEVPGFGAGFFCQCPTGLPQPTCGVPTDACNPNPCQNDGICSPSGATFTCQCVGLFTGPTCTQTQVSACMPNPCNNGGTCVEVPGFGDGFVCQCPAGLPQPTCGVPVDACNPNPCQNGGICSPSGATFTCQCLGLFTGPTCTQTPGDACVNNPCSGNECRISATSLAGYTCHSVTGVPCITG